MTDAWMKRGAERQEFLESLKRQIIDEEEESHQRLTVQIPLAIAVMELLGASSPAPITVVAKEKVWHLLSKKVWPQIKSFARTPEEEKALLAELLLWEANSLANYFKAPLQTQEIDEPEKLFEGRQAMDKAD